MNAQEPFSEASLGELEREPIPGLDPENDHDEPEDDGDDDDEEDEKDDD